MPRTMFVFWMTISAFAGGSLVLALPKALVHKPNVYVNQVVRQNVFLNCVASLPDSTSPSTVKQCGEEAERIATTGKDDSNVIKYRKKVD